jgi:hypothetical protein
MRPLSLGAKAKRREAEMRRRAIVGALLLVGVGVVLGTTVFRAGIAGATGLQKAEQNVIVKNSAAEAVPVKEQNLAGGNIKVHEQGTVPAAQSGTWHVSVDGKPTVASADVTTLAGTFVGAPAGGNAFTEAVDADVSHYRTVRVLTNCFSGGSCANIDVNVYSIVGSRSYLLDQFPMANFVSQTRTYDVMGELIAVQLQNHNPGAIPNVGVAVYGRAN